MATKRQIDDYFTKNSKEIKTYISKVIAKYKKYYKEYTNDDIFTFTYLYCTENLDKIEEEKIENFVNKYISNSIKWARSKFNYDSKKLDLIELSNVDFSIEWVDEIDHKIAQEEEYNQQRAKIAYFFKTMLKDQVEKIIFKKMFYEFKTAKTISDEMNVPYHFIQPITKKLKDSIKDYINNTL